MSTEIQPWTEPRELGQPVSQPIVRRFLAPSAINLSLLLNSTAFDPHARAKHSGFTVYSSPAHDPHYIRGIACTVVDILSKSGDTWALPSGFSEKATPRALQVLRDLGHLSFMPEVGGRRSFGPDGVRAGRYILAQTFIAECIAFGTRWSTTPQGDTHAAVVEVQTEHAPNYKLSAQPKFLEVSASDSPPDEGGQPAPEERPLP